MVVNIDGWLADSAWSYPVGTVSAEASRLLQVTRESLYRGIAQAMPGNRIGDIAHAIQSFAESQGYSVVRHFVGHGSADGCTKIPRCHTSAIRIREYS